MPDKLKIKAPAKINLTLDVIGRRTDGYHDLKMVVQTIDVYDEIMIEKKGTPEIILTTDSEFLNKLPMEENLVYQAAKLMQKKFCITYGFSIHISKKIPAAAGLAGGSADCAATLIAVNKLCSLNLTTAELCEIGVTLGADVPFCLTMGTALVEGIGELITPLPELAPLWVLLIKPAVSVSTAAVYQQIDNRISIPHPDTKIVIDAISRHDTVLMAQNLSNSLEAVTAAEYPIIKEIKEFFLQNGSIGAVMSGSGSTAYGLFQDETLASLAEKTAREKYPDYDVILCRTKMPEPLME